jgi:hypothetical protein
MEQIARDPPLFAFMLDAAQLLPWPRLLSAARFRHSDFKQTVRYAAAAGASIDDWFGSIVPVPFENRVAGVLTLGEGDTEWRDATDGAGNWTLRTEGSA